MSNWCENTIKFETEDKELIEKIRNDMQSDMFCFDFNNIIPMPKKLDDWRHWMLENWGSNNYYGSEYLGDGTWSVTTAWNPPYRVLEKLSKKYGCTVTDEYWIELGMGCGKLTVENGEIIDDEEYEEVEEEVEGTNIVRVHIVPKKK